MNRTRKRRIKSRKQRGGKKSRKKRKTRKRRNKVQKGGSIIFDKLKKMGGGLVEYFMNSLTSMGKHEGEWVENARKKGLLNNNQMNNQMNNQSHNMNGGGRKRKRKKKRRQK